MREHARHKGLPEVATHTRRLSAGGVCVKDAALVFRFLECRGSRSNEMTLNITAPNGCDLKDKTGEMQVIAERCLKMWDIRRA